MILTSKGPPLEKNQIFQKKNLFCKQSYFFFLNSYCTCSMLMFDITLIYQKIFCMKIFIFHHGLLTAGLAKTTAHRVLFLVSMDRQRSKKFDESHFWALGCLLTASGRLESIRAIMPPPLSSKVIPEPVQNRVKMRRVTILSETNCFLLH